MKYTEDFDELVRRFSAVKDVSGIMLGGSYGTGTNDKDSDYDVYVYADSVIPVETRSSILKDLLKYAEINNQFWETEDDGVLAASGISIDIVYRDIGWVRDNIRGKLEHGYADAGYTTCIWFNFVNSVILYDRDGTFAELQSEFRTDYPEKLRQNIINKNYALLKKQIPAYYFQIEKALKRGDLVSVNHRVAAFLASYFDIILAFNRELHPGEKKLVNYILQNCSEVPADMSVHIEFILKHAADSDMKLLDGIDKLISSLDAMLGFKN